MSEIDPSLTVCNELERDLKILVKSLNLWVNSKPLIECLAQDKGLIAVLCTILKSLKAMEG